jgi:hypothetical protein
MNLIEFLVNLKLPEDQRYSTLTKYIYRNANMYNE